jgi:predicted nucleic acid-binding Zn ribbon protein
MSDYEEYLITALGGHVGECFVCGKSTKYLDISFDTWVCSEKCQKKLDKEYYEAVIKSID